MNYPWERFAHLSQRVFNTPLAIRPEKAEMIVAAIADRLGIVKVNGAVPAPMAVVVDEFGDGDDRNDNGYDLVGGIAILSVEGTLVHKNGTLRPYSGMTGYDAIRHGLSISLEDPAAKAIAVAIDSGGGEVSGCFDLVDAIHAARGKKPIWAILDESAYSAAYAIASACDRIILPRTGGAGSIGVITMHVDFSKALKKGGIAVTMIQHGARKSDCNEYQPLSDPARTEIQAEIDRLGQLFAETVARNRELAVADVLGMEAGCFFGPAAVAAGLADAVMAPDEAFRELLSSL